jgi:hypothetical protein
MPPADVPNWFCVNAGGSFLAPPRIWEALSKYSFALKTLLQVLVRFAADLVGPGFVLRLITPPENLHLS